MQPSTHFLTVCGLCVALLFSTSAAAHGKHQHGHDHGRAHGHAHSEDHAHDHGHDHDHEGHSHGAHVHGLAHFDGVLDGNRLLIEVRTPGWDLVGFERAPRDDAERARIAATRDTLSQAARLVAFEPAEACTPSAPARVTLPTSIDPDAERTDHAHPGDWSIEWSFECADAGSLRALRIDWFDAFPETQRIAVQWIGPDGQTGLELTPASRRIPVRGR